MAPSAIGYATAAAAVAVTGLCLLGCGGAYGGGTPAEQLRGWATSSGFESTLTRLRGDLAQVAGAAVGTPLRTACDVLVTDSLAANEELPTPDDSLSAALSRAYGAAGAAGHDCFRGAAGDQGLLTRAAAERTRALADLVRAEARYDEVTATVPRSS